MITHLELFAGIGGFRRAIDLFGQDAGEKVKCVGFSEIDSYATKTYKANYDITNEVEMGDIVEFTSKNENIRQLPNFILLTGGFPCQSFSMMGKKSGFDDVRGNVFFRIIDILKIKQPPFVLLENVRNLKTHDKGNTFNVVKESLKNVGYEYFYSDVFNTSEFELAHTRNRVYIFASRIPLPLDFKFDAKSVIKHFRSIKNKSTMTQKSILDVLDKNVDEKYYLSETLKPTILADGSKNFKSKSDINQLIARPLTATMVKMHRACQDNYYSDGFINSLNPIEYLKNNIFTKEELAKQRIRKLTPKEAFALQGFSHDFVIKAEQEKVSNHQLYKQAGNAVSVNTVYAIIHYLFSNFKINSYVL